MVWIFSNHMLQLKEGNCVTRLDVSLLSICRLGISFLKKCDPEEASFVGMRVCHC